MNLTLRKPFTVALEGARGTGKTTLAGNLRDLWRRENTIATPCILLDPGYVTPLVEAMRAGERDRVLYHQAMVEWFLRERAALDSGDLLYVFLDVERPEQLAERAKVEPEELGRELVTFRALMAERAVIADVLKFDATQEPEQLLRNVNEHLAHRSPSTIVAKPSKEAGHDRNGKPALQVTR